jgi:A/G-specific adenine glycosylase
MLQQTQVDTVIPYYNRFLSAYPTVADLARADLDDVLKLWEGLGYYSRARNLHKAAVAITENHDGVVPKDYHGLLALPGFGPYTTAAVLSIAYGKSHAVLDGNVIRVLARLHGLQETADRPAARRRLQALADEILNVDRPGDHNQAMMELGATVCKPRNAECDACPIESHCEAFKNDWVSEIPKKSKAKPRPEYAFVAGIIHREGQYLICRRKESGLLGGLWEFPSLQLKKAKSKPAVTGSIRKAIGLETTIHRHFRTVKHAYTHFSAVVDTYACEWETGEPVSDEHDQYAWVGIGTIADYAYSRIARKLVDALIREKTSSKQHACWITIKESNQ